MVPPESKVKEGEKPLGTDGGRSLVDESGGLLLWRFWSSSGSNEWFPKSQNPQDYIPQVQVGLPGCCNSTVSKSQDCSEITRIAQALPEKKLVHTQELKIFRSEALIQIAEQARCHREKQDTSLYSAPEQQQESNLVDICVPSAFDQFLDISFPCTMCCRLDDPDNIDSESSVRSWEIDRSLADIECNNFLCESHRMLCVGSSVPQNAVSQKKQAFILYYIAS
ncbi:hypothetical protein WISP_146243 [Willisornis vidua]|uniref:CE295 protein n=1 Tax=Willisornis vidua TaxID=1566151 RepID=A0ABQ9CKQ4_9PASS|nr:hypothetical protein WISP_146243 [Willisornis vidua]